MRKVRPQDIRTDFVSLIQQRLDHFMRIETALKGTPHEKKDLSLLSGMTLHSAYVDFECFLSDLILAYINRDFSQYQLHLRTKITQSVEDKFGTWAASKTTLTSIRHITVPELEMILDPKNYNLTFKDASTIKQRCHEWISAPYKDNIVNLADEECRFIDAIHAIRNYIAHQSPSSKTIMNQKLGTMVTGPACPNLNLGRGVHEVHDVGTFLKTSITGTRRVQLYLQRLSVIASNL